MVLIFIKEIKMKKLLLLTTFALVALTACADEYADLRKMTVQDYLADKKKMREVLDKCANHEIKDQEICATAKEAVNQNFDAW